MLLKQPFSSIELSCLIYRSIPTISVSQALFDDLSDDPRSQDIAVDVEMGARVGPAATGSPMIHRPFDQSAWYSVLLWPFNHISQSRMSVGSYGVLYGSLEADTSLRESLHYAITGFLADRLDGKQPTRVDRRVHSVDLARLVVDVREPDVIAQQFSNPTSLVFAQTESSHLRDLGAQGVMYRSARCEGTNVGLFTPDGLSNPRVAFDVRIMWEGADVVVYRGNSEVFRQPS